MAHPGPRKGGMGRWLIGGCVGVLVLCCASGTIVTILANEDAQKIAPLKDVCSGVPAANAAVLNATPGIQRVIAFERRGSTWAHDYDLVQLAWRGEEVATTPLVLCTEPETEELVERCSYGGLAQGIGTLERWGYRRDVRLLEARTGRLITQTTLRGAPPTACPAQESFGRSNTERRYGTHVGSLQVEGAIGTTVLGTPR